MATTYIPFGVRVNGVMPGTTVTEIMGTLGISKEDRDKVLLLLLSHCSSTPRATQPDATCRLAALRNQ